MLFPLELAPASLHWAVERFTGGWIHREALDGEKSAEGIRPFRLLPEFNYLYTSLRLLLYGTRLYKIIVRKVCNRTCKVHKKIGNRSAPLPALVRGFWLEAPFIIH